MSEPDQISADPGTPAFEHCDQCNAPVDREQRYCVNCGNHRRHVPDPVAKYLSQATARSSGTASGGALVPTAGGRLGRSPGGWLGLDLLGALALALVPVAAAVGIAIGRSSNNGDAKLVQALNHEQSLATTVTRPSGAPVAGTAASSDAAAVAKLAKAKAKAKAATKTTAAATPSSGKVTKVTGAKVTAAAQAAGSAEAKKIQNSTGSNYVQGANNLPSSVVVGP